MDTRSPRLWLAAAVLAAPLSVRAASPVSVPAPDRQALSGVDLRPLFADEATFTSYCQVHDWFYASYLENSRRLQHPIGEVYRAAAKKNEEHFQKACAEVVDGRSREAFLREHRDVCERACDAAASMRLGPRAPQVITECRSVCAVSLETFASFKAVR